jgi:hypothetical protein
MKVLQFTSKVPDPRYIQLSLNHVSTSKYVVPKLLLISLAMPIVEGVALLFEGSYDIAEETYGCMSVAYGLSPTITVLTGKQEYDDNIYLATGIE